MTPWLYPRSPRPYCPSCGASAMVHTYYSTTMTGAVKWKRHDCWRCGYSWQAPADATTGGSL